MDRPIESEHSLASRQFAESFGEIEGSSYSTYEGRPVRWAFDVKPSNRTQRVIIAGGEHINRHIVLLASAEHAFTCMLYGKAIGAQSLETVEPHTVIRISQVPAEASWYCDSFYLSRHQIAGMREVDIVAVALHALESGLEPDAAEIAVMQRSPAWFSTPDANTRKGDIPKLGRLVRSLRRAHRLRALNAPSIIIKEDLERATETWKQLDPQSVTEWPSDILPIAKELGIV